MVNRTAKCSSLIIPDKQGQDEAISAVFHELLANTFARTIPPRLIKERKKKKKKKKNVRYRFSYSRRNSHRNDKEPVNAIYERLARVGYSRTSAWLNISAEREATSFGDVCGVASNPFR